MTNRQLDKYTTWAQLKSRNRGDYVAVLVHKDYFIFVFDSKIDSTYIKKLNTYTRNYSITSGLYKVSPEGKLEYKPINVTSNVINTINLFVVVPRTKSFF